MNLDKLKELQEIHGTDGNWNYDAYMMGLYNGLELAIATLENRIPNYKETPNEWVGDKRK